MKTILTRGNEKSVAIRPYTQSCCNDRTQTQTPLVFVWVHLGVAAREGMGQRAAAGLAGATSSLPARTTDTTTHAPKHRPALHCQHDKDKDKDAQYAMLLAGLQTPWPRGLFPSSTRSPSSPQCSNIRSTLRTPPQHTHQPTTPTTTQKGAQAVL